MAQQAAGIHQAAGVRSAVGAITKITQTSSRLRPTDGTASVALMGTRGSLSSPNTNQSLLMSRASLQKYSSRRSSSETSAVTSKSRSILSGEIGPGAGTSPILEGHIQIVSSVECGEKVVSVRHSDDGSVLVGGLVNGSIKVFNPTNGNLVAVLDNEEVQHDSMPISRISCKPYLDGHPNTLLAGTYVSGSLRIWNYASGVCLGQAQDENKNAEYLCLSHNPFADVIAVGLDNGHIKLFDEQTLQVTSLLKKSLSSSKVDGHTNRVFCIKNHPQNPHEFVSGGWDNTLQFWDARSPHAIRSVYGLFVCGEGLVFDKRGKELMAASWRPWKNLQFIDYSTGAITGEVEPTDSLPHYLNCTQYLGKDFIIVGATDRSLIRVYDRQKKTTVASIREMPYTGSGCGVYDLDVPLKGNFALQLASPSNKFVVTNRTSISTIEFTR